MLKDVALRVIERAGVAVPWDQILEIVMIFVDRCFPEAKSFAVAVKDLGPFQQVALIVTVREVTGLRRRKQVLAVANAIIEEAEAMDEASLMALHGEVCKELGYTA